MEELSFDKQVIALKPKLESYLLKLAKDKNKAEDILQDVFYKAFKYQNRFQEGTNLGAWLITIARNTFYDSTTGRLSKTEKNTSYVDAIYDYQLVRNSDKNQALENLNLEVLWEVINSLDDAYKIPFVMSFRGHKYKEIAEHLDVPIGTIKNRIFTAREAIKEQLTSLGYEKHTSSKFEKEVV